MLFQGHRYCQACKRDKVPLVPTSTEPGVKWVCLDPKECLEAFKRRRSLLAK